MFASSNTGSLRGLPHGDSILVVVASFMAAQSILPAEVMPAVSAEVWPSASICAILERPLHTGQWNRAYAIFHASEKRVNHSGLPIGGKKRILTTLCSALV